MDLGGYRTRPTKYRDRTREERDLERRLWRGIDHAVIRRILAPAWERGLDQRRGFDALIDDAESAGIVAPDEAAYLRWWRANDVARRS